MSSKFECTLTLNEVYWKSNKATAIKKSPPSAFGALGAYYTVIENFSPCGYQSWQQAHFVKYPYLLVLIF